MYAICPHGKQLNRKPNIFVRGSSEQWRYQAKKTDCQGCPLRAQCTKGKGAKMLCVNVYRDDLEIHAARRKADPDQTRGLMGRHRAISEGIVNNLMNHQDVRYAHWKGVGFGPSGGRPHHRDAQHTQVVQDPTRTAQARNAEDRSLI